MLKGNEPDNENQKDAGKEREQEQKSQQTAIPSYSIYLRLDVVLYYLMLFKCTLLWVCVWFNSQLTIHFYSMSGK